MQSNRGRDTLPELARAQLSIARAFVSASTTRRSPACAEMFGHRLDATSASRCLSTDASGTAAHFMPRGQRQTVNGGELSSTGNISRDARTNAALVETADGGRLRFWDHALGDIVGVRSSR